MGAQTENIVPGRAATRDELVMFWRTSGSERKYNEGGRKTSEVGKTLNGEDEPVKGAGHVIGDMEGGRWPLPLK